MSGPYSFQSFVYEPMAEADMFRLGSAEAALRRHREEDELYWTVDRARDFFVVETPGGGATPVFLFGLRDSHFSVEFLRYEERRSEDDGRETYRLEFGEGVMYLPAGLRGLEEEMRGLAYEGVFAHRKLRMELEDDEEGRPRGIVKSIDIAIQATRYFSV